VTAKRGDIWYAALNPTLGSEQAGRRPVLVIQNNSVNQFTSTVLAVPFTTNLRRAALPTCLRVSSGEGGLKTDSVLLCHQLRALDQSRLRDKLGEASEETIAAVEACLLFILGIGSWE
jgi:mRNA interferase MazF